MIRVVGLDLSLTSAGIARCTVDGDQVSTHAQAIATDPSGKGLDGRWLRLNWLAGKLADAVGVPHLVLVEAPTYARNVTGSAHDRAGLWWLTIDRIMRAAPLAEVAEVHSSHLKVYATGKGTRVGKPAVIAGARSAWGHLFEIPSGKGADDIADAVTLAALGAHVLGHPLVPLPDERARAVAMTKLRKD